MAKLAFSTDDTLFPLMTKARDFLLSDSQTMLISGESGCGKSTFNQRLEYELWKEYKSGYAITIFVNLPTLMNPERELISEQLKMYGFLEYQILELERHRQLILICDGYDESQLSCNLYVTNQLNQNGLYHVKMIITCRSQYLVGVNYRAQFAPIASDQCHLAAVDSLREYIIASFSDSQIEDYIETV